MTSFHILVITVLFNNKSKVDIICKKHGVFKQTINAHLNGSGCPKCINRVSNGHLEIIEYLKKYNNNIIVNDRKIIYPYELDIYIPDFKLAIEYHGLWYHSYNKKESKKEKYYHFMKYNKCSNKNIRLIQIFENEWKLRKDIIKSKIDYIFNNIKRIYARDCILYELSMGDYNDFMIKNHLQGGINASIRYGLFYNDELISVMGFKKSIKYDFELSRFANKIGVAVIGGASKLFSKFCKLNINKSILSYADIRYSDGNLYKKLNFNFSGITSPNYFYYDGKNLFNRIKFQKYKLRNILVDYNEKLSEVENMFNNGYRRIWDAGHFRFVKVIE